MSEWIIPLLVLGLTVLLSWPVGLYLARVMDGTLPLPGWLRAVERLVDTGPQSWRQYALALLLFNVVMFVFGFAVLVAQPHLPFAPEGKGPLAASTVFNTTASFLTNTNLQHYSGEVHLSYATQILFVTWNMFVSAAVGFGVVGAVIRGLRGDPHIGNFYVDVWRGVAYVFLPLCLISGVVLLASGIPMTFEPAAEVTTLEPGPASRVINGQEEGKDKPQVIARGPVAAVLPIKHLGTNGGGYFGANAAHPFENPTGWANVLECVSIVVLSFGLVVAFGRMLNRPGDALVIYAVMFALLITITAWAVFFEARPNSGLLAQAELTQERDGLAVPAQPALPVDSAGLGNLEGKELRFGPSAGPTWAAVTTATSCGAVNCMHDSLNPLSGLTPLVGMWLNCVFGGKGVGLINFLVYLVVAVFLAGLMVGRTPEYLGKKLEAREMKLAMLALLVHPILILGPTGVFAASDWGMKSTSNPGAHGFSQVLYEFSSASANNGSGFEGLADTYGFAEAAQNPSTPAPHAAAWDISTGLIMLFGRFIPILAPLALAGSLAGKKRVPFTVGTLRTDTLTFGCVLLGTILLVGALLFLPSAVLGPVAEQFAPLPFGR